MSGSCVRTLKSLALSGIAAVAASCGGCQATGPTELMVTNAAGALHAGVAALETGQDDLALSRFADVSRLLPEEPAGHANTGLLHLRRQAIDEAAAALTEAGRRAPKSPEVLRLRALAAGRQGKLDDALRLLREAQRINPDDVLTAYALAMALETAATPGQTVEAATVLERLAASSQNLAVGVEWVRLAARAGDAAAARRAIDALVPRSRPWPSDVVERFVTLQDAVAASDLSSASVAAVFLKNVLLQEPTYRRAMAVVSPEGGTPIRQLVTVAVPTSSAYPADDALGFSTANAWSQPVAVTDVGVVSPDGEGLVIVAASGTGVRAGEALVDRSTHVAAITPADLNNDFHEDLVLVEGGRLRLVAGRAGAALALQVPTGLPTVRRVWPADVDLDGDLDLVLDAGRGEPLVLRNNTDGTFLPVRPFAGVTGAKDFVWADLDDEGTPDAAFLSESGQVVVALNDRGGRFTMSEVPGLGPATALAALSRAGATGGGGFGLVVALGQGRLSQAHRDPESLTWQITALATGDPDVATTALHVGDVDNNGVPDLLASASGRTTVWLADDRGYHRVTNVAMETRALGDLNGDGVLELVGVGAGGLATVGTPTLSRGYRAQVFRPRAASLTGDQRINTFGLGGEVDVRFSGRHQRAIIATSQVHLGLGAAPQADVVRITWPNGVLQAEFDVAPGAAIRADQRLKGSCPWLFGWDGAQMTFVTDVIWRSPLGLRINAQATADVVMTEDRVRIPGAGLVARDGTYDLRITAELWETHFFDLVALEAVDHPVGTEVFIDERFAIPAPSLEPIVTGPLSPLPLVRDDEGRDVTAVVRSRDDQHLAFAGLGAYQGITRRHAIEFELPESAPRTGPLWLVATGWVHPTDSSVNVAISQGRHSPPSGLTLEVEVAPGQFTPVQPNLGFPSGKDKTVLIDLSEGFPSSGRRRARLVTNLEIYWDRLAWAVGRPDVHVERRQLPLRVADLQYRGFSRTVQADPSVPERPEYELAGTSPRWRDLEGYYTRFGDVRPLLGLVDDRYVILNAGDELLMRFAAAPPLSAGRVRDFVFTGDGWVKDGDFNTSFSRTVLPLPTHASGRYDTPPGRLFDDPVYQRHRRDFDEYHTRYVAPRVR
jgi:ASPIC and UnbV